ncbi:hypothetical protein [Rhodococcus sp. NPDC057529]|uniref:hypothetical protein n=1 Tax=Rhodococcus sp. NPDC057529 TaxID=3346158 RepID=UPI00366B1A72
MHDDLTAILVDARSVAAQDHRELVGPNSDSSQGPQIMVIQRRRFDRDGGPAFARFGFGAFTDDEPRNGVVGIDGIGVCG